MAMIPTVERKEGVEAVPGVPGWAGIGCGSRLEEGMHCAVSFVPEKVVFWAPFVVAPFHLPPPFNAFMHAWDILR